MYNFEGLGFPLNCAFKWLHSTVIAMKISPFLSKKKLISMPS